jgi:hypothetical protein
MDRMQSMTRVPYKDHPMREFHSYQETPHPIFSFWNARSPDSSYHKEYADHPTTWNFNNWSTETDAIDPVQELISDNMWGVKFRTKGAHPFRVMRILTSDFPGLYTQIHWFDTSSGRGASGTTVSGKEETSSVWGNVVTHKKFEEMNGVGSCRCHLGPSHFRSTKNFVDCIHLPFSLAEAIADFEFSSSFVD